MQSVLELPGVIEAILQESLIRDAAFLPVVEDIAGYPARPLTLRQYHALCIADSPLIPPFRVTSARELAVFLWAVNPGYSKDKKARLKFGERCRVFQCPDPPWLRTRSGLRRWLRKFVRSVGIFSRTLVAARAFMEEALMDRPGTTPFNGYQASYFSDLAATSAILAREYGGGIEPYLDMPVKAIFQLLNLQRLNQGTEARPTILFNRLSERAINRALQSN